MRVFSDPILVRDEELRQLDSQLTPSLDQADLEEFKTPLDQISRAVNEISKSFSGSFLGYHSKVYYEAFADPPASAQFSAEWGLQSAYGMRSSGAWKQYNESEVIDHIAQLSNKADIVYAERVDEVARDAFTKVKSEALSILENETRDSADNFIKKTIDDIESLQLTSPAHILHEFSPSGKFFSRDTLAVTQGIKTPAHLLPLSKVISIERTMRTCKRLSENLNKMASYLERKEKKVIKAELVGTNVFLGHGRSNLWRELKDFIENRLNLPCDEFNRVPVAGVTNIARLSEMLEASAFAFLILTAEEETKEGDLQARMNVIHEVGLFQGRLGFTKAIVLLEEGCAEFSNIQGLGQIRFPRDNIRAAFEEIRQVLEREKLL